MSNSSRCLFPIVAWLGFFLKLCSKWHQLFLNTFIVSEAFFENAASLFFSLLSNFIIIYHFISFQTFLRNTDLVIKLRLFPQTFCSNSVSKLTHIIDNELPSTVLMTRRCDLYNYLYIGNYSLYCIIWCLKSSWYVSTTISASSFLFFKQEGIVSDGGTTFIARYVTSNAAYSHRILLTDRSGRWQTDHVHSLLAGESR